MSYTRVTWESGNYVDQEIPYDCQGIMKSLFLLITVDLEQDQSAWMGIFLWSYAVIFLQLRSRPRSRIGMGQP